MTDLDYSTLDPGIRRTVRWLRSLGYETTDSGDGLSKMAQYDGDQDRAFAEGGVWNIPHVAVQVDPTLIVSAARRIRASLMETFGHPVGRIEATYFPEDDVAVVMLMDLHDSMLPPGVGEP